MTRQHAAYTLSVIVVTYNNEKWIAPALTSLFIDLPEDVEIIIVNDGSTDNSDAEIRACIHGHAIQRIKYINQVNQGVSAARNAGLDNATGDYIAFVDGDDRVSRHYYAQLMPILRQKKCDLLEFRLTRDITVLQRSEGETQDTVTVQEISLREEDASPLLATFKAAQWHLLNKIFHRRILGNDRFPLNRRYEDMCFVPFQYLKCQKIIMIDTILYYYRINQAGITENLCESDAEDIFFAMRKMCDFIQDNPQKKKTCTWMVVNSFLQGRKIIGKKKGAYQYTKTMLNDIKLALSCCDSTVIPSKVYRKMRYTKIDGAISKLNRCILKFLKNKSGNSRQDD